MIRDLELSDKKFWFFVIALAFLSRLFIFFDFEKANLLVWENKGSDFETFRNWANIMVKEGRWLSDFDPNATTSPAPVFYAPFYQAPLYPYFLALTSKMLTIDLSRFEGIRSLVLVQMILGLLMLWPVFVISKRLMAKNLAQLTVVLFLLCEVTVFYQTIFLRVFLLTFVYVFVVHNALLLIDRRTFKRALFCGIWMGLAWICKPNFLVFVPVFLVWFLWQRPRDETLGAWISKISFVLLGILSILSGPLLRNFHLRQKADIPLFSLTSRGPYAYINGNSFHSFEKTQGLGYDVEYLMAKYYRQYFYAQDSAFAKKVLGGPENPDWKEDQDSLFSTMKLVWAEHSLKHSWWTHFWPMMSVKFKAFFNSFEIPNNKNIYLYQSYTDALKFHFVSSFLILVFLLSGLPVLISRWKEPAISLLILFILTYLVTTIGFYFIARFRAPVLPFMLILGLTGSLELIKYLKSNKSQIAYILLLIPLLAISIAWPRDVRGGAYQEQFEKNQGIRLADYHGYALLKITAEKNEQALEVVNTALSQPGGQTHIHLLNLKMCLLVYQDREEPREVFSQEICDLLENKRFSLPYGALYSFALDHLFRKAYREKNIKSIKIYGAKILENYKAFGFDSIKEERRQSLADHPLSEPLALDKIKAVLNAP